VCDKTCVFFFFPIINKYFLMAKRSLLSRCPSYIKRVLWRVAKLLSYIEDARCLRVNKISHRHISRYNSFSPETELASWHRVTTTCTTRFNPSSPHFEAFVFLEYYVL